RTRSATTQVGRSPMERKVLTGYMRAPASRPRLFSSMVSLVGANLVGKGEAMHRRIGIQDLDLLLVQERAGGAIVLGQRGAVADDGGDLGALRRRQVVLDAGDLEGGRHAVLEALALGVQVPLLRHPRGGGGVDLLGGGLHP